MHPPEPPSAPPAVAEALPAPTAPPTPAGFWRRAFAYLVDSLLLWFPVSVLKVGIGLPLLEASLGREPDGRDAVVFLASALLHLVYTGWLDSSEARGTLGKQLLAIRAERTDGGRLSFARAACRQVASYLSCLTLGLGFLMCLWTRRRQSLHDWIAGAVLVRSEPPATERTPA